MNKPNKTFSKTYSKTIDNRSENLPTLWSNYRANIELEQHNNVRVIDNKTNKNAIKDNVLDIIKSANDMLVLCSFLLADEGVEQALLAAEKRGVRVYCMIAAETRLDREEPQGEFDQKVLAQHKAMLKNMAGKIMFRTSSSFHAKVVLADPFETHPKGGLLTANITKDAMTRNEELLLKLENKEIRQLAEYLKWGLWEASEHESIKSGAFEFVSTQNAVKHPKEDLPVIATTEQRQQISNTALTMIQNAQQSITVSCFGWDLKHATVQALIKKAHSGIAVKVFARTRPASMPALEALQKAGAQVFGFKWLHAKALLIDEHEAMVMSANFQAHGMDEGFELGIIFNDSRVDELIHVFKIWQVKCVWQLRATPTIGEVLGKVLLWDGKKLDEDEIQKSIAFNLGTVTANSAEDLQAPAPALTRPGEHLHLAHQLDCEWIVDAPKLSKDAKEEFRQDVPEGKNKDEKNHNKKKSKQAKLPYSPPIYREPNGQKVVVIASPEQLEPARNLKQKLNLEAIVVR